MRVAIAGTGRLGVSVIEQVLTSHRHEPVALLLNGRATRGIRRNQHLFLGRFLPKRESPLPWAIAARIPLIWLDRQSEEEIALVESCEPDILITCGFSIILKPSLLQLPSVACINVHSSLLPRHRGPCPFNHSILSGDTESGVTFHVTAEGIDTGDIIEQTTFAVESKDTAFDLYNRASDTVAERIVDVLDRIDDEGIAGRPQDESHATYDPKVTPQDFKLRWERPAEELHRLFRACMPYEQVWCYQDDNPVRVLRSGFSADPVDAPPGTVLTSRPVGIATGEGTFTIYAGMTGGRLPMLWPMPWNRPKEGDVLT